MSRTIVVTEFLSLDGVMEAPNEWNLEYVEETLGADVQSELDRASALLYGRVTFGVMAGAWPTRTGPTADRFNTLPKYVVSSTLGEVTWARSTVLRGDGATVTRKLKQDGEGRVLVWGSRRLVQSMAAADLVDEYVLYVHPLVLGKGGRLFDHGLCRRLTLIDHRAFARGVVALRYGRA